MRSVIATVSDVKWLSLDVVNQMDLVFDHQVNIGLARESLRQKALYSIVPAYALNEMFMLTIYQLIRLSQNLFYIKTTIITY